MKRPKGKQLQKLRSERVERSFAHICETGGARRTWLRGLKKINKRYRLTVAAHNLGLIMRSLFGTGKPREFAALRALQHLQTSTSTALAAIRTTSGFLTTPRRNGEPLCNPRHHPVCVAP